MNCLNSADLFRICLTPSGSEAVTSAINGPRLLCFRPSTSAAPLLSDVRAKCSTLMELIRKSNASCLGAPPPCCRVGCAALVGSSWLQNGNERVQRLCGESEKTSVDAVDLEGATAANEHLLNCCVGQSWQICKSDLHKQTKSMLKSSKCNSCG